MKIYSKKVTKIFNGKEIEVNKVSYDIATKFITIPYCPNREGWVFPGGNLEKDYNAARKRATALSNNIAAMNQRTFAKQSA